MIAKTPLYALTSMFLALAASSDHAEAREQWRYEVDKRQARHFELIAEGADNGMLTRREVRRLRGEQMRIARMKRAFLADGGLDWPESQTLRYAQDAANEHIFRARNNEDRRRHW